MHGINISYRYSGEEDRWERAVSTFVAAIDADTELGGRFEYRVMASKNSDARVHWGSWDAPETVQLLQSREYFKTFAAELQEMAGETLVTTPVALKASTHANS